MNKKQIEHLNRQRAAEQIEAHMSIGSFPVLSCGILPGPNGGTKLVIFGFSRDMDQNEILEILRDYVKDLEGMVETKVLAPVVPLNPTQ